MQDLSARTERVAFWEAVVHNVSMRTYRISVRKFELNDRRGISVIYSDIRGKTTCEPASGSTVTASKTAETDE